MTSTPRSRRASASFAALLIGVAAAGAAHAKQSDRDKPVEVEHADSFDGFNKPNSVTTLRGHVRISQGTMKISGDLAKVYVDADQAVSRVEITGTPAHIEQLDDNGNLVQGDASTLDYDNVKGIAVLTGNASVVQKGRGEAHGDKLTYDTKSSEITGESGGHGQVHLIFQPKKKPAAPEPAPGAKQP